MTDVTFITGNEHKAKYLAKLLGMPVVHQKLDLDELQSLDLKVITEHKVRQAYQIAKKPVLVEDVSLSITSMGALPGPFIKWFMDSMGAEKICRMADAFPDRAALSSCCYGYYDGTELQLLYSELEGTMSEHPRGDTGFGWNPIFIPKGEEMTLGEMAEAEFERHYLNIKPIKQLAAFLQTRASNSR